MQTIRFYYNGIKVNEGKLQKVYYRMGGYVHLPENTITIYCNSYAGFSKEVCEEFSVKNNTDTRTDYVERDHIRVRRTENHAIPFLLILLCLHKNEPSWLEISEDQLILRRCAYWCKLSGSPTGNTAKQRIRIPIANKFTPEAVTNILRDIRDGIMLP